MIRFIDLTREYQSIHVEVQAALNAVMNSGQFVLGENVEAFEAEFASYCGAKFGVGVGSGTSALQLALLSIGVQPDDEVITVPFTALPTVLAISAARARPIFVDIGTYFTIDPDRLEHAISLRTKAIVPVHLYGQVANMDPILEIAGRHGLPVIEDACQAHGAEYKGKKAGSFGQLGCFSFYPTKNLGAYGDAGMIVTNDATHYERLKSIRNLAQATAHHQGIKGLNSRLDEIQAAILRVKLKYLDQWNKRRRELASIYHKELPGDSLICPAEAPYGRHVFHQYVIRIKRRDELMRFLSQKGIETLIHYPRPVHLQGAYRDLGLGKGSYPVSEMCCEEVLSLPIHPFMKNENIPVICKQISNFFHA